MPVRQKHSWLRQERLVWIGLILNSQVDYYGTELQIWRKTRDWFFMET